MGFHRAGFTVIGVDKLRQYRYPFTYIRADVFSDAAKSLIGYADVIHASPPCQHYSDLALRNYNWYRHPDLIGMTRRMLVKSGKPYVIENVEGSPLKDPILLCGVSFPELRVIRHRYFESNIDIPAPEHFKHPLCFTSDRRKPHYGQLDEMRDFVQVNGGGNCSVDAARDAMGISWMRKSELNEAIPPAYTEHIGRYLQTYLQISRRWIDVGALGLF